eukprot:scaffold536_cov250-Pinguiococcus_pyrenoidosus.AAC.2
MLSTTFLPGCGGGDGALHSFRASSGGVRQGQRCASVLTLGASASHGRPEPATVLARAPRSTQRHAHA